MAISILVLALTGGGGSAPTPAFRLPDKSGLKEWIKRHLRAIGRARDNLAGKAAAALAGITGSIVSWLLCTLGSQKICGPWPLLQEPCFSWLLGTD